MFMSVVVFGDQVGGFIFLALDFHQRINQKQNKDSNQPEILSESENCRQGLVAANLANITNMIRFNFSDYTLQLQVLVNVGD